MPDLENIASKVITMLPALSSSPALPTIGKCMAYLESLSTNPAVPTNKLDHFYELLDLHYASLELQPQALQKVGERLISFSKVNYFPSNLLETCPGLIIRLLLLEDIKIRQEGLSKKIKSAGQELKDAKLRLLNLQEAKEKEIEGSSDLINSINDLKLVIKGLRLSLNKTLGQYLFKTNSIFESAKLLQALSAYSCYLNSYQKEFLADLLPILGDSLKEMFRDEDVTRRFLEHIQLTRIIVLMRFS